MHADYHHENWVVIWHPKNQSQPEYFGPYCASEAIVVADYLRRGDNQAEVVRHAEAWPQASDDHEMLASALEWAERRLAFWRGEVL